MATWLVTCRMWTARRCVWTMRRTSCFRQPDPYLFSRAVAGAVCGCKYPPAEPGALGIGSLEAATLNPKLCLIGRRTKYALPTSPRSFIQFFATPENRCLLRIASPLDGVKVSRSSVVKLHFVCVVAHDLRFRRWATAVNVKLILPPRQSRGVSRLC